MADTERQEQVQNQSFNSQALELPYSYQYSMNAARSPATSDFLNHRPMLDRAHIFPTPPTSASSIIGMSSESGKVPQEGNEASQLPDDSVDTHTQLLRRYNLPSPRQPSSSTLYNIMSSERGTPNGGSDSIFYGSQSDKGNEMSNTHVPSKPAAYTSNISKKRGRDDYDDNAPPSRGSGSRGFDTQKSHKTLHGSSTNRELMTTPETTPPPDSKEDALQQHSTIPKISTTKSASGNRHRYGMDEIRRVIVQRLSGDNICHELDVSTTRRQKVDAEDLTLAQEPQNIQMYQAGFTIHWKIKEFIQEQFGSLATTTLGSVIALTGTAIHAQATTIRGYLEQNWPDSGHLLVGLIQESFDCGLAVSKEHYKYADNSSDDVWYHGVRIIYLPGLYSPDEVIVWGSKRFVVEIGEQIAWLGAALRASENGQIGRSQVEILAREKQYDIEFDVRFVSDSLPEGEKSCWHDLFVNPVIVHGFPIPDRGEERGLEIPLQMMASLGGASHAIEYEGGLVMKGFSSMFVPLKRSGDSIQWHFVRNEDDSRLEYWQADKQCSGRALLDSVDQDSLTSTRAFLGWWGKTVTRLGTADVNYDNIDWSATKEPDRSATFSGGTIGFQNFAIGELSFAVAPKDSKFHISRSRSYQNVIRYASRTPVVLYDTCEKRGWLVPSSAVIAHIVQTRNAREQFSINGKPVNIVPTDPIHNVYEAAKNMLLVNASTKLEVDVGEGTTVYFRDVVLGVWSLMEYIMDRDIKKEASSDPTMQLTTRKSIRGWEFMDLVDEISPFRQKETDIEKSCGDWPDLVQDINAIVLFASGFEDIIMPDQGPRTGLCHPWRTLPQEKDYLAASVSMLNSLYEKAGSRLTKQHLTSTHLQWHRGPSLFEECVSAGAYACNCDRLQRIVHESRMSLGTVTPPGLLEEQGAVIFGQAKHPLRTPAPTHPKEPKHVMYCQGQNVPLIVKTDTPSSPDSVSSNYCKSPSQTALGSGTTFATSVQSESEDSEELDEKTEDDAIPRSLKRPREEPQILMSEIGDGQRRRSRLDEPNIKIQRCEQTSSPLVILGEGVLKQEHRLRRKPSFTYAENEDITRKQHWVDDLDRLPVRSQFQQKSR